MKFFNNRIVTKSCSMEDAVKAVKAKEAKQVPSLDEILAKIDAHNKQVKTAGSSAPVKVAEVVQKAEAKAEEKKSPEVAVASVKVEVSSDLNADKKAGIENIPEDKRAAPFGKKKDDGKGDDKEEDKKDDKDENEKDACMANSSKQLKVAKALDFRQWSAEDVVTSWNQHGSISACVRNVSGKTSDPKTYCGLLFAASDVAKQSMQKQAAPQAKAEKVAEKAPEQKGSWKKIAKLTDKERAMLDKYYRKLYGDYYVDALLTDY